MTPAIISALKIKAALYIKLTREINERDNRKREIGRSIAALSGLVGEDKDSETPIELEGVGKVQRVFCKGRSTITRESLAGALAQEKIAGEKANRIIERALLAGAEYSYIDVVPEGGRARRPE